MGSQEIYPTPRQRSILIGSLLGDGTMEWRWKHPRIRFDHGLQQEQYIRWLKRELRPLAGKLVVIRQWHHRARKHYDRWHFATPIRRELDEFYELFYDNGVKRVPRRISEFLDPLALAVWHMDDGHKRTDCNALRLHTNAFTVDGVQLLQEALCKKFGITAHQHHIRRNVEERVLYIPSGANTKRFIETVRPHIHPSMRYKISLTS